MEEKLDFEKLSKDVMHETKNDYSSKIDFSQIINTPMLKIIFDFFNVLNDKKKLQKELGLLIKGFVDSRNNYVENLPESANGNLNFKVNLEYKEEFALFVVLSRFQVDGNWVSTISFTSNKHTYISSEFIYKKIIFGALSNSNLKGSYFVMPHNELAWEKKALEKRDYGDIYLPKETMEDLKLFTGLFEKRGEIMRYLFAGTPGTGKTEATLAISNVLKDKGVTIIKTVVCDLLKEKIELAELLSPSLLIFDDIDLSLGSRNKGGVSRSLGAFLDALDGTDKMSPSVGIIATTNSMEHTDSAASRPGRFDKIMTFEEITKQNIRDIISKSLRQNFTISKTHPTSKLFLDNKIIDNFYNSRLTGSHIFSYTKMIMRKIDILEKEDLNSDWILNEIEHELKSINNIKNGNFLSNEKLKNKNNSKRIGLIPNEDEMEEDFYEEDELYLDGEVENTPLNERDYRHMSSDENYSDDDSC